MNNNAAVVLAAALIRFQNMVVISKEGRVAFLLTFSERTDENV